MRNASSNPTAYERRALRGPTAGGRVVSARRVTWTLATLASVVTQVACAHTTDVSTNPPGATVYVDGERVGDAPVAVRQEAGLFRRRTVRVEKPGFVPMESELTQTRPNWPVLAAAGCLAAPTCGLSCLGMLYATQYPARYEYRLSPDPASPPVSPAEERPGESDAEATLPF